MRLQVLSEEQKKTIYTGALDLLERTGVRVDNDEGIELLHGSGARVGRDRRVRLPPRLVAETISKAPRSISVYNRLGDKVLVLEDQRTYFCSQVDSIYFWDPYDRTRRKCVRADARLGAILCDALPNIHMVSLSALYADIPGQIALRIGHKDSIMNCAKPFMHGTACLADLKIIAEMAAVIVGGSEELVRHPYYLHYAEPLSPLIHTDEGVAKMLFCVEHGIPVVYSPAPLAGASAPVTGAATLLASLAESLSGIVMAQLRRPGAPVIFGGLPTVMDMATTIFSYGAPEMSLWSAALTEMAHYIHLPVFNTAGCTDAVAFDQQAAAESAISSLMAILSGANLVHDVGFIEAGKSASLELIAATDEFIGMIEHMREGIEINAETLALAEMDRVGPGGNFLGEEHTLRHFRKNWFPKLMNRLNYEQWTAAGSLSFGDKANQRVREILEKHQPVPLPADVTAELGKMEKSWWREIS